MLKNLQNILFLKFKKFIGLQGVVINDKHIETIVRQMLKRVEVKDPGDSELLTGEVIDLLDINKINDKLRKKKRNQQHLREFY